MGFADDMRRFQLDIESRTREAFVETVTEVTRSVVEGSEITGAPGQPVDTGALRASWHTEFNSPTEATLGTDLEYAPIIEDNPRGVTFQNHGPHSVKLTIAGFQRIVDDVARRIAGRR